MSEWRVKIKDNERAGLAHAFDWELQRQVPDKSFFSQGGGEWEYVMAAEAKTREQAIKDANFARAAIVAEEKREAGAEYVQLD